jgi:hypothetical protein
MNRSIRTRLVFAAALAGGMVAAAAQHSLEIIALRYRTVEQVLPVLQPLVEPGGTLSGARNQLFLRASPGNVAEIRRALESIDRPSKRLQISIRFDDALEREQRDIAVSGTVGSDSRSRFAASARDSRGASTERVDQRLQVLEGARAFIATGASRPFRVPGGTEIRDLATGFEVVPRLSGDRVLLEVAAQKETPGDRPGVYHGQRVASTVSARLGEWVEIGGTAAASTGSAGGIGSASAGRAAGSRRVWVKVEELH